MTEDPKSNNTELDELVSVKLPRKDVMQLREIIERDRSMSVVARYVRTAVLGFVGVVLATIAFWDKIKHGILSALGG